MTRLFQKAMKEIEGLPAPEQDALAAWILEELESEREWDRLLAKSPKTLERLADQALGEFRAGRTTPLDPGSL